MGSAWTPLPGQEALFVAALPDDLAAVFAEAALPLADAEPALFFAPEREAVLDAVLLAVLLAVLPVVLAAVPAAVLAAVLLAALAGAFVAVLAATLGVVFAAGVAAAFAAVPAGDFAAAFDGALPGDLSAGLEEAAGLLVARVPPERIDFLPSDFAAGFVAAVALSREVAALSGCPA